MISIAGSGAAWIDDPARFTQTAAQDSGSSPRRPPRGANFNPGVSIHSAHGCWPKLGYWECVRQPRRSGSIQKRRSMRSVKLLAP